MISVYVGVVACDHYDLPNRLGEMRDWIEEQWNSIPVEYRKEATFDIDGEGRVEINYWRPETEAERAKAMQERQRADAWAEARERQLLADLKAKYEGKS